MASAWEAFLGKPCNLIPHSSGESCGVYTIVKAGSKQGNTHIWLQRYAGGNLRMANDGSVDNNGGQGPWATFEISPECQPAEFKLLSVASKEKGFYVGTDDQGKLVKDSASTRWKIELASNTAAKLHWLATVGQDSSRFGPFQMLETSVGCTLLGCGPANGNLRVNEHGQVCLGGGSGPWAELRSEQVGNGYRFNAVGWTEKGWCLGAKGNKLIGNATRNDQQTVFRLIEAGDEEGPWTNGASWTSKFHAWPDFIEDAQLSEEAGIFFIENGYLHMPSVIPREMIDAALRDINAALCCPDGVRQDDEGRLAFCTKVAGSDAVLALLYGTHVWSMAQRLIGKSKVCRIHGGQIALRPPDPKIAEQQPTAALGDRAWHIDGMDKGRHSPFTVLLGITLSSASKPGHGNFCVWPGSHHKLQPLMRDEIAAERPDGALFEFASKPTLDNGMQVLAEPGDVVFAHQKLAHAGGPNSSPDVRYQVYFRLRHVDHEANVDSGVLMDDMWVEFEGLKELLPGRI